jgi:DNA-binding winged helix-turn-helix (wHTH) protein
VAPSGLALPLTQQEYRLLEVLMRNRNEVCSKVDLHTSLFTDEGEPELHRIDVVISRLRHKARLQGITLPIRAIFGKGLAFLPDLSPAGSGALPVSIPPSARVIANMFSVWCFLLIFSVFERNERNETDSTLRIFYIDMAS